MNCQACHQPMTLIDDGFPWHPNCAPQFAALPGTSGMSTYDLELKEDLIEIVYWAQANSRRSQQVALGCSEVGSECDRRLAYRIAGTPECGNRNDPWPAIVGTSIHSWMETAVNDYQHVHSISKWFTEMEVLPSPIVKGHTDLYDSERALVLDWKFPGSDNLRKMRLDGPSPQYVTQVMLYGLGHVNAGRKVDRVGIVALGRQGWLKDMHVWTTEFDRSVADAALQRIYRIGQVLLDNNVESNAALWEYIPAVPSRLCTWCPFYRKSNSVANQYGCPGK